MRAGIPTSTAIVLALSWLAGCSVRHAAADAPDIRTVPADLTPPPMVESTPAAGIRVRQTLPDRDHSDVYHALYLPRNWQPDRRYPVLVEFAGNGPTRSVHGDLCSGRVEDCSLGFGLAGGQDFIWVCVPFLNGDGTANVTRWWGDAPTHDPRPTIEYLIELVPWVCDHFGGDQDNVVLCGFSRGSIACNFIGLHDDRIAPLWKAFVVFSHYDGVDTRWGYPGADRASAGERLRRLNGRPQCIIHEVSANNVTNLQATKQYLASSGVAAPFQFVLTGFRNHSDKWILRPSEARTQVRAWLRQAVSVPDRSSD